MDRVGVLLLSAMLLIGCDQLVKAWIVSRFREGQTLSLGALALRRVTNDRALQGPRRRQAALWTLWTVEVVFFAGIVQFSHFFQGTAAAVALGVALGGAGSNLLDRLYRNGVVDFIDFRFWPVFNIADAAIVTGALIGLIYIM